MPNFLAVDDQSTNSCHTVSATREQNVLLIVHSSTYNCCFPSTLLLTTHKQLNHIQFTVH